MDDQLKHYSDKLAYEIDSWRPEGRPRSFIPHRTMSSETTTAIDKVAVVVTYCDGIGCNASTKGALNMLGLGFGVKELIGGLDWWKRDGHKTHAGAVVEKCVTCGCGSTS